MQVLKARWCIKGSLDPEVMDVQTASPTLSNDGFSIALHLAAHRKLSVEDGDCIFER